MHLTWVSDLTLMHLHKKEVISEFDIDSFYSNNASVLGDTSKNFWNRQFATCKNTISISSPTSKEFLMFSRTGTSWYSIDSFLQNLFVFVYIKSEQFFLVQSVRDEKTEIRSIKKCIILDTVTIPKWSQAYRKRPSKVILFRISWPRILSSSLAEVMVVVIWTRHFFKFVCFDVYFFLNY